LSCIIKQPLHQKPGASWFAWKREAMAASNSKNGRLPMDEPLGVASRAGDAVGSAGNRRGRTTGIPDHAGVRANHVGSVRNHKPTWRFCNAAIPMVLGRRTCFESNGCTSNCRRLRAQPAARLRPVSLGRGRTRLAAGLGRAWGRVRLDRSPPVSVAPWQIPPATRPRRARHQIKTARARRVATAQPRQGDPTANPQSKPCDRLIGVIRTSRQVSTMHADQR
jgi:hypothetical protein